MSITGSRASFMRKIKKPFDDLVPPPPHLPPTTERILWWLLSNTFCICIRYTSPRAIPNYLRQRCCSVTLTIPTELRYYTYRRCVLSNSAFMLYVCAVDKASRCPDSLVIRLVLPLRWLGTPVTVPTYSTISAVRG